MCRQVDQWLCYWVMTWYMPIKVNASIVEVELNMRWWIMYVKVRKNWHKGGFIFRTFERLKSDFQELILWLPFPFESFFLSIPREEEKPLKDPCRLLRSDHWWNRVEHLWAWDTERGGWGERGELNYNKKKERDRKWRTDEDNVLF